MGAALSANAATITTQATADTFVSEHAGLGGGTTPQGSREYLFSIAPDGYRSYPLIQFDLSSFAGSTVTSDAELKVTFNVSPFFGVMDFEIRANQAAWSETSTTWNNFDFGNSTLLTNKTVDGRRVNRGDQVSFLVPQASVQNWISNGASNFGVQLKSLTGRDIQWASRESGFAPTLTFTTAVPEPETYAMLLAGLGLMGAVVRRRKQKSTAA